MKPGDVVLVRSIYEKKVRWCFPHHFVGEERGRYVAYLQPGSRGVAMGHTPDYPVRIAAGESPREHVWNTHHVLWLTRLGERHALGLFWDEAWELRAWYVNLQLPTRLNRTCFDSDDLALDIVVKPDGSWSWKDEDDFALAQELGILDAAAAAAVRAEGERVIAERPWPTGWEGWRPPADWKPLGLPTDWDRV